MAGRSGSGGNKSCNSGLVVGTGGANRDRGRSAGAGGFGTGAQGGSHWHGKYCVVGLVDEDSGMDWGECGRFFCDRYTGFLSVSTFAAYR